MLLILLYLHKKLSSKNPIQKKLLINKTTKGEYHLVLSIKDQNWLESIALKEKKPSLVQETIKEITESVLNETLTMVSTSNVKFMAIINPEVNSKLVLDLEISENEAAEIKVKNTTCFEETVALKLSNTYKRTAS